MTELLDVWVKAARRNKESTRDVLDQNSDVLALFHILKYDTFENVRTQANNAWKLFIDNTPKELKRLIPFLMDTLIDIITVDGDLGEIAKICLTAFIPKYADQILKEVFTHISATKSKNQNNINILNGICLTLNEMVRSLPNYHVV